VVFFPRIFGSGYASNQSLWAYCTDATDKSLVGGDGGAMLVSGQCRNENNIIHLKGVETGSPAPTGWTAVRNADDSLFTIASGAAWFNVYYRLTPR